MRNTEKDTIRAEIKSVLASLSTTQRSDKSASVIAQIRGLEVYQNARTILMYASLPGELDLDGLMQNALDEGRVVCVPRVDWDQKTMCPVRISNVDSDLVVGRYGVRSPGGTCDEIPVSELELVIAPGLAFDRACGRLGRGAGFYDRLLARGVRCPIVGVCFACQIVGRVHMEEHDRVMDRVVFEDGELRREHG